MRPTLWRGIPGRSLPVISKLAGQRNVALGRRAVLGLGAALGIVLWWSGSHDAGKTLMLFCTASMVLAATVLVTTGKGYLRAALAQGTVPLIGFVLTLFI